MSYGYGLSVINSHLLRVPGCSSPTFSVVDPCFWALFGNHGAAAFAAGPYTFELLERVGFADLELPSLSYVTQAGGRLPPEAVTRYAGLGCVVKPFEGWFPSGLIHGSEAGNFRQGMGRNGTAFPRTSSANRGYLAGRGIKVTIPERSNQIAGRAWRGSKGGRPRSFDEEAYKGRNVAERCFNGLNLGPDLDQIRGLAIHPSDDVRHLSTWSRPTANLSGPRKQATPSRWQFC